MASRSAHGDPIIVMLCSVAGTFRAGDKEAAVELAGPSALQPLAMTSDSIQGPWLTGMWFRRLVLLVGILLCISYAALLIPVGVNLPVSWPGLVLVVIGLTGGISCIRYFRQQRRVLLIPAG